jgi:hypothetical protein
MNRLSMMFFEVMYGEFDEAEGEWHTAQAWLCRASAWGRRLPRVSRCGDCGGEMGPPPGLECECTRGAA